MRPHRLTPWERATGVPQASQPGWVAASYSLRLTLAFWLILGLFLFPAYGFWGGVLALMFARMAALDLTTYTLPNVYTLPLMAVSFWAALGAGHLIATLVLWLALAVLAGVGRGFPQAKMGIGEGDLKLLAAMGGFLALPSVLTAIVAGCLLWLPFACYAPKRALPLGVPIILGWALVLAFPALPILLFGPITH